MPVKIPSFNYKRLRDRTARIYTACISNPYLAGHVLEPQTFSTLVTVLRRALKLKVACEGALRESMLEFAGQELTDDVYDSIAVKLAGGYDDIRQGKPVTAVTGVPKQGLWAPTKIVEMRFDAVRNNRPYLKMTAMVVVGPLAGRSFNQQMPAKSVVTGFAIHLGWKKWGGRPAHSELVQLVFTGKIVNDKRKGLQIDEFKCTAQQLKVNKEIRDLRDEPCVNNHRYQCKTCPIGYSSCPRGTHRYTWVPRHCPRCRDDRAIFDPAQPNVKVCLVCRSKQARTLWTQERRNMT